MSEQRVIITRPIVGICHMQVCACNDATDEEILDKCNLDNHAGTTNGWAKVCRESEDGTGPVQCADDPNRTHFLVAC